MDSKIHYSKNQYGFIDIFFFVLFITTIAIFMGLSIVSVIDKKINNVSINIPSVILNVDTDTNDNIKISQNKNNIEEFIVTDTNDIHNYDNLKVTTLAMSDNFNMENLNNPDNKNSTDDLAKQVVHHTSSQKIIKPTLVIDKSVQGIPHDTKSINTTTLVIDKSVPCGTSMNIYDNDLSNTYKNIKMLQSYNSTSDKINDHTYKTIHFLGQEIPIDDTTTKGYNYWQYSDDVNPNAIRYQRILSQNTKGLPPEDTRYKNIPVGWNYAFHNSPAILSTP